VGIDEGAQGVAESISDPPFPRHLIEIGLRGEEEAEPL